VFEERHFTPRVQSRHYTHVQVQSTDRWGSPTNSFASTERWTLAHCRPETADLRSLL